MGSKNVKSFSSMASTVFETPEDMVFMQATIWMRCTAFPKKDDLSNSRSPVSDTKCVTFRFYTEKC